MTDNDWLANLKVGDEVIVQHAPDDPGFTTEVGRLTATLVITKCKRRFRLKGGRKSGSPYGGRLAESTPDRRGAIQHQQLYLQFALVRWRNLPLDVLVKVSLLLEENAK